MAVRPSSVIFPPAEIGEVDFHPRHHGYIARVHDRRHLPLQLCERDGHGELGEVDLVVGGVEIGDRVVPVPRKEREGVRAVPAGERRRRPLRL